MYTTLRSKTGSLGEVGGSQRGHDGASLGRLKLIYWFQGPVITDKTKGAAVPPVSFSHHPAVDGSISVAQLSMFPVLFPPICLHLPSHLVLFLPRYVGTATLRPAHLSCPRPERGIAAPRATVAGVASLVMPRGVLFHLPGYGVRYGVEEGQLSPRILLAASPLALTCSLSLLYLSLWESITHIPTFTSARQDGSEDVWTYTHTVEVPTDGHYSTEGRLQSSKSHLMLSIEFIASLQILSPGSPGISPQHNSHQLARTRAYQIRPICRMTWV
ncbi:uncharacterized protein BDZ83DRAFT_275416 [Colletotrichum acutatum]|uniref:Uncharacterized protein n=1 Tax=Glomerella acutata TaxID=27357 RepID=A0AAD8UTD7_GLOAC|nr:uncharacterized protein BDZ83DRAFT_275416 [Colletotrichum acutatum]KAK1725995.1 hypothetical protein BDZ83DRAFT_275416 [Colletotrichum acutatum]